MTRGRRRPGDVHALPYTWDWTGTTFTWDSRAGRYDTLDHAGAALGVRVHDGRIVGAAPRDFEKPPVPQADPDGRGNIDTPVYDPTHDARFAWCRDCWHSRALEHFDVYPEHRADFDHEVIA